MIVPNYWWLSRGTAMLIASILLVWSIVAGRLMNTHTNGNDLYYRLCHVQARLRHVTCKVIITWYVNDDWSYLSFPYSIWKSLWLSEFCVLGTKIQNRLTFLVTSTFFHYRGFQTWTRTKSDVRCFCLHIYYVIIGTILFNAYLSQSIICDLIYQLLCLFQD